MAAMPCPPRSVRMSSGASASRAARMRRAVCASSPETSGWRCRSRRKAVRSAISELLSIMGLLSPVRGQKKRAANAAPSTSTVQHRSDAAFDPVLQRGLGGGAGAVRDHLAILEDEQRRDAADAHGGGGVRVAVNVDLGDLDLAAHFFGQFFEGRTDLLARATPFGPEIDHDGNVGVLNFCVECLVCYGYGAHFMSPDRN